MDVREIAAKLTKAQRRTIIESRGCSYFYARRLKTIHYLSAWGLCTRRGDWDMKGYLTPLGLAVRAALLESETP